MVVWTVSQYLRSEVNKKINWSHIWDVFVFSKFFKFLMMNERFNCYPFFTPLSMFGTNRQSASGSGAIVVTADDQIREFFLNFPPYQLTVRGNFLRSLTDRRRCQNPQTSYRRSVCYQAVSLFFKVGRAGNCDDLQFDHERTELKYCIESLKVIIAKTEFCSEDETELGFFAGCCEWVHTRLTVWEANVRFGQGLGLSNRRHKRPHNL